MIKKQTTIQNSVSLSGKGIHTGVNVNLSFHPAKANEGYLFKRSDLEGELIFKAHIDNVVDTQRSTSIGKNDVRISTVEHLLAALSGLQIDNVIVELNGEEVPWMDGSSLPFVEHLESAGIQELDEDREYLEIGSVISIKDGDSEITIIPSDSFRVSAMLEYNHTAIGSQHAQLDNILDFKTEIAAARSYVLLQEIKPLLDQNLIQGGDMDNSLIFADRNTDFELLNQLAKNVGTSEITINENGVVGDNDLIYENEAARHKLLDLMGDFALLGKPINAHIIAKRPGHAINNKAVKKLKKLYLSKQDSIPVYDPNKKPLYDINDIKRMLPHRPPFLLVDKILEISKSHVVGMKNVTMNEGFFVGHFPDEPVMPGVLQIEAMAQTGGILVLSSVPDPENYATYFVKIDAVKFRAKVVPGDTIIFNLHLASPIRRGMVHMIGKGYVGTKCCIEATMLAQVVKMK